MDALGIEAHIGRGGGRQAGREEGGRDYMDALGIEAHIVSYRTCLFRIWC